MLDYPLKDVREGVVKEPLSRSGAISPLQVKVMDDGEYLQGLGGQAACRMVETG